MAAQHLHLSQLLLAAVALVFWTGSKVEYLRSVAAVAVVQLQQLPIVVAQRLHLSLLLLVAEGLDSWTGFKVEYLR